MTKNEVPTWMRVVVVILGALVGFHWVSSLVGTGLLIVLAVVESTRAFTISVISAVVLGLCGAVAGPLLLRKILRHRTRKAYITAICILTVMAVTPLPEPYVEVMM